jgi:hypothetical protein
VAQAIDALLDEARVRFSETSAARCRNSECAWQSSSSTSPRLSAPICRVSDKLPLRNIASFMRLEWKVLNRNHLETGGPDHVAELIATLAANWYTLERIL